MDIERKKQIKTKIGYGVLIFLFLYFIWPTPYEYTRKHPSIVRVNRFTGVKEHSSDEGWKDSNGLTFWQRVGLQSSE